ncbi:QRFP-like peptide receptor [Macrosteles quadrilineatus]|uniref:QRFP-like peptide receptor n=1 Tax=Macrosteles quadrilineatus TaxID=74068 RepID=UPI0023E1F1B4|nr:QRFP-like peptide receptor [Macrosteles quadrilineatus]
MVLVIVSLVDNTTDYDDYDYLEALNTYYWEELLPPLVVYSVTMVSLVDNTTDYDDYDYLEALNTYYWEELLPPLVVYSVTMVSLVDNTTDYDDYDYLEALNTYYWEELLPPLVVYSVTMVLGIIGNSLIIFTICRYRRMKSTTNVFLASLASADLLLIIICIPVKLAKLFSYGWTLGLFLCKLLHYMQSVSAICSVLTLTAMSVERYYAIVHPMKAKYLCTISQAKKIILCIWLASFLLATPMLVVQILEVVGEKHPAYWCTRNRDDVALWRLHELYMLMLILVIPTAVMACTYTCICWEVWSVMQARYDMTSGKATLTCENFPLSCKRTTSFKQSFKANQEENNTVKQVIKMLVMIVVVFVICWAPMLIDNCLTAWQVLASERPGSILKHMYTIFTLMAYFNSCVNPIVYGFMSKNFRESFQKALCLCWRRSPRRQLSVSQTRTTSLRYNDRNSVLT